jgi:SAM-dependent methyltransferase
LLSDYPRYAWQLLTGARAAWEIEIARKRACDLAALIDLARPRDILDVGNGSLRPQYALLGAAGHRVTGIDLVNRPGQDWRREAYKVMRRMYAAQLGLTADAISGSRLVGGNVCLLPFADQSFDLAISCAAFEHFLDIPAMLDELHRVLRPGGLVWSIIHIFTSPSGGHNVSFTQYPLRSLPAGAEPWDHLRRRKLPPAGVPLNRWRKGQYLEAFARRFEVLKSYTALREGGQWLTPEVAAELNAYSADELTCAHYVIVARKTC